MEKNAEKIMLQVSMIFIITELVRSWLPQTFLIR